MFLSNQELHNITGYKSGAYQIKWLQSNNIRHIIAADGRPRVSEALIRCILGENPTARRSADQEPDFDALRAAVQK